MPANTKSDNAEVKRRVEEIFRLRLNGTKRQVILRYASEKGWGVSDRQIETYISRADEMLVERREKSRKRVLARHLAQREELYYQAFKAQDYRTALLILENDARLRGLYPDRGLKELRKILAEQAQQIAEIERRFRAAGQVPTTPQGNPPTVTPLPNSTYNNGLSVNIKCVREC